MAMSSLPLEDATQLDQYAGQQNPNIGPTIWNGGSSLSGTPLTAQEQAIFYRDLARFAAIYSKERDLSELLLADVDRFSLAAKIAKLTIGVNPVFGGASATGSAIGMRLIRACTVMSNTGVSGGVYSTAAEVLNWLQSYSAVGWTDVFGSTSHPVDLSSTGVSGYAATNFANRVLLAFGALLDPVTSPKIGEYKFVISQKTYPVHNLDWLPAGDLYYAKFAGFVIIPVNVRFNMRGDIQPAPGQDAAQLFGLEFSTGDFLANET